MTWDAGYNDVQGNVLQNLKVNKTVPQNILNLLQDVVSTFPTNKRVEVKAYSRVDNDLGEFLISVKTL